MDVSTLSISHHSLFLLHPQLLFFFIFVTLWFSMLDMDLTQYFTWRQIKRRPATKVARDLFCRCQTEIHELDRLTKHDDVFWLKKRVETNKVRKEVWASILCVKIKNV